MNSLIHDYFILSPHIPKINLPNIPPVPNPLKLFIKNYDGVYTLSVDVTKSIASGSFGSVFNCKLTNTTNNISNDNFLIKLIWPEKDVVTGKIFLGQCSYDLIFKELEKQYLMYSLTKDSEFHNIPQTFPNLLSITNYSTNYEKKYNDYLMPYQGFNCCQGIIIEKIPINFSMIQKAIFNIYKTAEECVNQIFIIFVQLQKIVTEYYNKYKFKHNDFHTENVLFKKVDKIIYPQIIDFGESVINFGNIKIIPTIEQIGKIYGINGNENLEKEIISLYSSHPLSDSHFYIFTTYMRYKGLPESILSNFKKRLDDIYKFSTIDVKNGLIYKNKIMIPIKTDFLEIYKQAYSQFRIARENKTQGTINIYDTLCHQIDRLLPLRYLAYFVSIYY